MKKIIATGVALLAASIAVSLAFPQLAHGGTGGQAPSTPVTYADPDLTTAARPACSSV